ncbi:MAG: glutamate racemase [Armatimonadaceae bacterium]
MAEPIAAEGKGQASTAPIGVFDSGVGGITVAAEILRRNPSERIIYIGDTANVPYGERSAGDIRLFSVGIARYLAERREVRGIVIACNTATSAAAEEVRVAVSVPVVAMEPGVKPAVAATQTGIIGVLATTGTLVGERFTSLVNRFAANLTVLTQPCPHWVELVEAGNSDTPEARLLVRRYVEPLRERNADVLVLGCTHFPLLRTPIQEVAGNGVTIIDTGPAVARRAEEVIPPRKDVSGQGILPAGIELLCTGEPERFARTARSLLNATEINAPVAFGQLRWKHGELVDNGTN